MNWEILSKLQREDLLSIVDNHFGVNTKDYNFNLNLLSLTMKKMISFITRYKVKLDLIFFYPWPFFNKSLFMPQGK